MYGHGTFNLRQEFIMTTHRPFSPLFGSGKNLAILLVIILAGLALRLLYFHGVWGTDDAEYVRLANAMARGNFIDYVNRNFVESITGPAHIPYRTALIFPLSVLFRLFGVSEPVLVIYPLLISLLVIVLAYLCGRLMFNPGAGLIAAALWAFMPNDIIRANAYLPDIPASFYGSLGVMVVLVFIYYDTGKRASLAAGGIIAGLIFGVSWLSKESVIYLIPFTAMLLVIMLRKDFNRGLTFGIAMAAASASVMAVEMIAYYTINGDLLSHFHGTEKSYSQTRSYLFYEGSRFGWPEGGSRLKALVKRLFMSGPSTIFLNPLFLYVPAFGLVAWAHSIYRRGCNSINIAGFWMITLAFMYNFSSCSTSSYTPLVLSDRYLHPIMFPASLLVAGFIIQMFSGTRTDDQADVGKERFFWGALISVMLVLIALNGTLRLVRDLGQTKSVYEPIKATKLITPADRVYTDPLTTKSLEFSWKYPESMNVVDFEDMRADDIGPNSFVLIDRFRVAWLKVNVDMWLTNEYGYHEPEFFKKPPESWKVVWQNVHATLYRVD